MPGDPNPRQGPIYYGTDYLEHRVHSRWIQLPANLIWAIVGEYSHEASEKYIQKGKYF